jgi:ABC-type hemin transport system substrate-binding protein
MAKININRQTVGNQIIADKIDVINLGTVQSKAELASELRKLLSVLQKETKAGKIDKKVSSSVESRIQKAVSETEKAEPKKKTILDHIEGAKSLLDGVSSATGLVTALMQAAKIAGSLFL